MKTTTFKGITSILLVITAFTALSFTSVNQKCEQLGVILNHIVDPARPDYKVIIAIPIEEQDKISCHLEHGDEMLPYDEIRYRSIIELQEDGANICNH